MTNLDDFFMETAINLSKLSKCVSYQVGAVIVKDSRIISMGYNGTPANFTNCNEVFDKDNFEREKHHEWSNVHEIHAELNAVLFAAKNGIAINECTMYVTLRPCDQCLKNIIQSGIKKVIYLEEYDKQSKNNDLLGNTSLIVKKYRKKVA
jgi:dCMP deaminase